MYFLFFILFICALAFVIEYVYMKLKKRNIDKRRTKIIKAQAGFVFLKGQVKRFNQSVIAPLTQQSCCGYSYLVIERSTEKIVHQENALVEFVLEDESSKCLIRSKSVGTFCNAKEWLPAIKFSNYINLEEAIQRNDLSDDPEKKTYRHMEYRRQENEPIYVEGIYHNNLKDLNLGSFNLKGAIVDDREKTSTKIIPAYYGAKMGTKIGRDRWWFQSILDFVFEVFAPFY